MTRFSWGIETRTSARVKELGIRFNLIGFDPTQKTKVEPSTKGKGGYEGRTPEAGQLLFH